MKNRKCSRCGKHFTTDHRAKMHIDSVHSGNGEVLKVTHPKPDDSDESFASRAVQAEIDEACGIYNPDQDWILP